VQFEDEEGEQRVEEEIGDLQEIKRSDVFGMVLQEGSPGLFSLSWDANMPHIPLNGALADMDIQLEQLASHSFCSPQSIVPCHLRNQGDRLLG
jgi:hypothetical protein